MKTPLLLDTCALIWLTGLTEARQAGKIGEALEEAQAEGLDIWISPITAWELGMLASKGRLTLTLPARNWLDRVMRIPGLRWAEMPVDVLLASHTLPGDVQGDPADRIIIATAREFGLRIITRDRKILDYAEKGHVMAMAC
jgi:PIN domain nuclease of toxin-antitoxin system